MSLLPPDATFEERVQDCFVAFRGCGLALSGVDAELLREWAELRIPFEVVARGIRRRAERALWDAKPNEPPLRSLKACRAAVEREIRHHLARVVGRAASTPSPQAEPLARKRQWRAAMRKLARDRPGLANSILRLDQRVHSVDALMSGAIRALPFWERIDLLKQARQALAVDPVGSTQARKLARRSARLAVFRKKFSLPNFW